MIEIPTSRMQAEQTLPPVNACQLPKCNDKPSLCRARVNDQMPGDALSILNRDCTNERLCNNTLLMTDSAAAGCTNVLQYISAWQQVYAIMLIGYARVSTHDQETAAQVAALKAV